MKSQDSTNTGLSCPGHNSYVHDILNPQFGLSLTLDAEQHYVH
jgi:hypothetical protein